VHLDIIVYRKTNLMRKLFLVYWHGYVLREEGTHCILLIAHIALCKSRLTPAHCISHIVYLTSYILHLTSYALHLTPYALRLTLYTLHLTSYIISYRILYRVTCTCLVCKTSMIRCFYHKAEIINFSSTSTYFGCRPIIRRYSCIYTTIGTYYSFFRWLSVVLDFNPTRTTDSHWIQIKPGQQSVI
jgi:hypothetical protein